MTKSIHLIPVTLPEQIGDLKKLETLIVNLNQLTGFPQSLSNLRSLKTINASHNHFAIMPVVVYSLRNLDVIDFSSNKITAVPDGINAIQAIEINLNQNQVLNAPCFLYLSLFDYLN